MTWLTGHLPCLLAAIRGTLLRMGWTANDIPDLVAGTLPQQRLLANCPCEVDADCLTELFHAALA